MKGDFYVFLFSRLFQFFFNRGGGGDMGGRGNDLFAFLTKNCCKKAAIYPKEKKDIFFSHSAIEFSKLEQGCF